jgi:hypothetical protein
MSDKRQVAELLVDLHHIGYAKGYAAGLDAAREAVANAIPVWDQDGWNVCSHKDALAAIDGLKGESNG